MVRRGPAGPLPAAGVVLAAVAAGIVADRSAVAAGRLVARRPGGWAAWWCLWRRGWLRLAAVAVLLAAAATAASWHHARWYLFAADNLGQFAGDASQPVCVEATAVSGPRNAPPADAGPISAGQVQRYCPHGRGTVGRARRRRLAACRRPARLSVNGPLPASRRATGCGCWPFGRAVAAAQPGRIRPGRVFRGDRVRSRLQAAYSESVTRLAAGRVERPAMAGLGPRRRQSAPGQVRGPRPLGHGGGGAAGAREQLEPDRIETFVETGTVHLLVIAGLHLGILAGAVSCRRASCPCRGAGLLLGWRASAVLHAAGRCPAAGGPRHGDGGGDVWGRLTSAAGRWVQLAGGGGLGGAGRQSVELFRPGASCRFCAWRA